MAQRIFILLIAVLFVYIASPLITPVAMGAVLAVLMIPLLERMEQRKLPTALSSAVLTIGITLLFLLPATLLLFYIAKNGAIQLQAWKDAPSAASGGTWIEAILDTPALRNALEWITDFFPIGMQELVESAEDLARNIGLKVADLLAGLLARLPGIFVGLAVIIVSIYFFLVDGRKLVFFVRKNSVFTAGQTEKLIHTLGGICRSVILASLVSGVVQAIVEMIFVASTGTRNALLVGGLVFVGSFIPLVGSAPATIGIAIHQFMAGNSKAGVILLIAALIVGTLDNLIRPLFLKGTANLHPLLAFVAAFGGLQTIGVLGVFLGPVVAAMFVATVQLVFERKDV
ncbi:MAG: hypothetical protein A2X94_08825 [Bdellovibrionales bacterium GWB1_55_8]|nr:MAG: hypothetical protein A2X94_08825 [Bdellovibrionales bacterium GWB1_55_8]